MSWQPFGIAIGNLSEVRRCRKSRLAPWASCARVAAQRAHALPLPRTLLPHARARAAPGPGSYAVCGDSQPAVEWPDTRRSHPRIGFWRRLAARSRTGHAPVGASAGRAGDVPGARAATMDVCTHVQECRSRERATGGAQLQQGVDSRIRKPVVEACTRIWTRYNAIIKSLFFNRSRSSVSGKSRLIM
jgi:hypothetical protein